MTGPQSEELVQDITRIQQRLYAYIITLLPDSERAQDVLQETNLVLWRKGHEFVAGTNFGAWAAKIAYYQVLAYRKRHSQDRHVFDDELLRDIATEAFQSTHKPDDRQDALKRCLEGLSVPERDLLARRYAGGASVQRLAGQLKRSVGTLSQQLYRIRTGLARCVESRLAAQEQ